MNPPVSSEPAAQLDANGVLRRAVVAVVAFSARFALLVFVVAIALAVAGAWYVAGHIAINTDSARLIASDVPWKVRSATFDAAFPQKSDLIAIVVDGDTPDVADKAAAQLAKSLAANTKLFRRVTRPDGGPFFEKNGLLFLDTPELGRTMDDLVTAQPALGTLAADPSVRGLMTTLQLALEGVKRGETTLDKLDPGLVVLGDTLESVSNYRPRPLSWRAMFGGKAPDPRELRRFVLAQPMLDYSALKPGENATRFIRETAASSGLDAAHGVRVRLTGNVPMADEEFGTLEENAGINSTVMVVALLVMVWLAVRSLRATFAIAVSLVVGLVVTAALGLALYGVLNLISVAFAVLFVGLGVDFGIQFAVSYRANAHREPDRFAALARAGREVGVSLLLAAVAIACGFFAFEPTDYRGVSELGVIAGIGMGVAFLASVTVLPALLSLLRVGGRAEGLSIAGFATLDTRITRNAVRVLVVAGLVVAACVAVLPKVRFDFDPLNLRSDKTEAVATIRDLSRDSRTSPDTIDVLAPSVDAARALAKRLEALPEVSMALTVASFVPSDQDAKLALIGDTASLLEPTLEPSTVQPAPRDIDDAQAMRTSAAALNEAASNVPEGSVPTPAAKHAARVAELLDSLADGTPGRRQALRDAVLPGLTATLTQLRMALKAQPVTLESLPKPLVDDWVARDGRARVEVFPKVAASPGDPAQKEAATKRFIAAVRTVAPDATGAPISIQESAATILHAFIQAGTWALIAITVLLVVVLRRPRDVLVTLASLSLGGIATLGLCVAFDIPLNYENIIALPLLFGIGVAFNIYFVIAWRNGTRHLLTTSLARAIVFSALTTATAFGSLWLSSHPGTASMGKLLALSLACTLVAALVVLPALLTATTRGARGAG